MVDMVKMIDNVCNMVKMVYNICNIFLNVPECFKTQKMHGKAVENFLTQDCVKMLFQ